MNLVFGSPLDLFSIASASFIVRLRRGGRKKLVPPYHRQLVRKHALNVEQKMLEKAPTHDY